MTLRYRFILICLGVLFCLVIARLFYWQVIRAEELSILARDQYNKSVVIEPQRGEIRTSDGFPLVSNKISYLLIANPKVVANKTETAEILASILEIDKASVSANLSKDLFWVSVASNIEPEKKERIEKLKLAGIDFEKQYTRFYPEASLAAHLVGFVGKDEIGNSKGYFGIEGYYDRLLKGKEGNLIQINDALGRPILAKLNKNSGEIDGSNLVLSIDRSVQFLAENELKDGVEKYGASSGMVAIMDPKTGNILAISAMPSFDPKDFQDYSDNLYKNPVITDTYEPGSTFKPLIMSAALNAKLITPQTKCSTCAGPVSIGGYEIHTWNNKYYKDINMTDIIMHSDNTGMVYVGTKLGLDRMLYYLDKFGIGKLTGIDLQGEVVPNLKPRDLWYKIDLATSSFGQGISVTPIELLSAIAAIANNGNRMEPHVVVEVDSADGNKAKIAPKIVDSPISAETAKVMTEIMVNAVNKGEANWVRIKGYRIAGKTGTASIPIQGHYDPNQTIASFVGFAPADNPKFAMLVVLNRPTTSIYGAETAAPIFFNIVKKLLLYYGISPDE